LLIHELSSAFEVHMTPDGESLYSLRGVVVSQYFERYLSQSKMHLRYKFSIFRRKDWAMKKKHSAFVLEVKS
jgi:hypothetical protein